VKHIRKIGTLKPVNEMLLKSWPFISNSATKEGCGLVPQTYSFTAHDAFYVNKMTQGTSWETGLTLAKSHFPTLLVLIMMR